MLFRRDRPKKLSFEDFVQKLRTSGFEVASLPGGRAKVSRNGVAAGIENAGEHPQLFERAGVIMGDQIGTLMDGGFQKFFQTPGGTTRPAVASELKNIHEFEEDLREQLGLTSLYNQSLGSVSNVYLYDRVKGRDSSVPKKPWEKKIRGQDPVEKV